MRIGLFGGSFDPFHLAHFLIARTARERFDLQRVIFLPCARSPLKQRRPVAGDRARLTMLRRGLQGHTWAEVSDWEIRQGGISYTADTVRALERRHPQAVLYWIMGSDQWDLLSSWKEPRVLRQKLRFLVFPRPHPPRTKRGFRMREIPLRLDISATEVRRRIRDRLPIEGMVMPSTEKMIRKHGWYR